MHLALEVTALNLIILLLIFFLVILISLIVVVILDLPAVGLESEEPVLVFLLLVILHSFTVECMEADEVEGVAEKECFNLLIVGART